MRTDEAPALSDAEVEAVLTDGSLELAGRLVSASNASFWGQVTLDGISVPCIYKPVQGERPLWDFPTGTLAGRELAARLVSEMGGWGLVPPTVLRDGRYGLGMCQRWIDIDTEHAYVDVVSAAFEQAGWIAVLEAEDHLSRPVLLVHRDTERLRDMAVFDAVINNADRKGGHVLVTADHMLWGCDHGVSFHEDNKLRTVLWGWADEPLRHSDLAQLERLSIALDGALGEALEPLLSEIEIETLGERVELLRAEDRMPIPDGSWPAIPWPAF
ncbi:MAG: SCO1664 family protein [Nocardioidaceae bacterium]